MLVHVDVPQHLSSLSSKVIIVWPRLRFQQKLIKTRLVWTTDRASWGRLASAFGAAGVGMAGPMAVRSALVFAWVDLWGYYLDVLGYITQTHTHLVLRLPVAQKCSGTVGMYTDPVASGFNWEHLETRVNYRPFSPCVRTRSVMSSLHHRLMIVI